MSMEQRWQARRHLYVYLEVLERDSGRSLGRLGDIHEQGLLLLSPGPYRQGEKFEVSIRVPTAMNKGLPDPTGTIVIRWSKPDLPGTQFQNGCSFDSSDPEARQRIMALVTRLGFSDGRMKIVLRDGDNAFVDLDERDQP
ncbi:MAG: PilZ domain-containing protein [Spirochaetota bacterium]